MVMLNERKLFSGKFFAVLARDSLRTIYCDLLRQAEVKYYVLIQQPKE